MSVCSIQADLRVAVVLVSNDYIMMLFGDLSNDVRYTSITLFANSYKGRDAIS